MLEAHNETLKNLIILFYIYNQPPWICEGWNDNHAHDHAHSIKIIRCEAFNLEKSWSVIQLSLSPQISIQSNPCWVKLKSYVKMPHSTFLSPLLSLLSHLSSFDDSTRNAKEETLVCVGERRRRRVMRERKTRDRKENMHAREVISPPERDA